MDLSDDVPDGGCSCRVGLRSSSIHGLTGARVDRELNPAALPRLTRLTHGAHACRVTYRKARYMDHHRTPMDKQWDSMREQGIYQISPAELKHIRSEGRSTQMCADCGRWHIS